MAKQDWGLGGAFPSNCHAGRAGIRVYGVPFLIVANFLGVPIIRIVVY